MLIDYIVTFLHLGLIEIRLNLTQDNYLTYLYGKICSVIKTNGGVSKSMLTLNETIIDVKKG